MQDEWKAIPGYEGYYEASKFGIIRSVARVVPHGKFGQVKAQSKILKPATDNRGYFKVALSKERVLRSFYVHSLVALAFLGKREIGKDITVNHIDCNKQNNNLDNLEYITRAANMRHAVENGLFPPKYGTHNGMAILTEDDVRAIRQHAASFPGRYYGRKQLAEKYGVSEAHIKDIVTKRRNIWPHV